MEKLIWIVMAFVAGSLLPIQAGMNSKLAKSGGSPLHATMLSFMIGFAALLLYISLTSQQVSWKGIREAPAYAWAGGLLGAFYIAVILFAFPRIGPGLTFGLIVAGQLLISMLMEHFQLMNTQPHAISLGRVAGLLLIIGGVIMMKKF